MSNYPIISLWAHPRSMSTAFERIMRSRGDCDCLHEPFMYDYYVARGIRQFPHFKAEPGRPTAFADISAMLLERAAESTVFCKDMAYYVWPAIQKHQDLLERMRHLFLIRDPKRAIMSYYKLDPALTLEEVGYESQWQLYRWLLNSGEAVPTILRAEDVQQHTEQALSAAWQSVGLDYCAEAFEWDQKNAPSDWQQVSGWHQSAIEATSIRTDTRTPEHIDQEFAELAADQPKLNDFLDHHQPFYDALAEAAWSPSAK